MLCERKCVELARDYMWILLKTVSENVFCSNLKSAPGWCWSDSLRHAILLSVLRKSGLWSVLSTTCRVRAFRVYSTDIHYTVFESRIQYSFSLRCKLSQSPGVGACQWEKGMYNYEMYVKCMWSWLKTVSEMCFARTEKQLPADADPICRGTRCFRSPYSEKQADSLGPGF
jgi:hypothetical protein